MSRYYIDCEFDGHDGPLLSLAMVREDGVSIHIRTLAEPKDPWVIANVWPLMTEQDADFMTMTDWVGGDIRDFIGGDPQPHVIADSPVDIARFCQAVSTGEDGGWASADYERMTFTVENVDCYPTDLPGAVQHNAWWDARALRHKLSAAA